MPLSFKALVRQYLNHEWRQSGSPVLLLVQASEDEKFS